MTNAKMKFYIFLMLLIVLLCQPVEAFAAFESLANSGRSIFKGLRDIIYPASAVGIIAVCIGGFFGNINWKWLTLIVIGLVVISLCGGFIAFFTNVSADSVAESVMTGDV